MAAFTLILPALAMIAILIPVWLVMVGGKAFIQIVKVRIATRWAHMQYNSIQEAWKKDNIDE